MDSGERGSWGEWEADLQRNFQRVVVGGEGERKWTYRGEGEKSDEGDF